MLYIKSEDNLARFVLGKPDNRTLVVFGVNPSTATDILFDRTVTKVIGFAERNGFNGWLILNIYPQRATDPKHMDLQINRTYHRENLAYIDFALKSLNSVVFLASWGNLIAQRQYLAECLQDIFNLADKFSFEWRSIGLPTKGGHPRHSSRVGYDNPLVAFDISNYIKSL